jgi:hypothetical protein
MSIAIRFLMNAAKTWLKRLQNTVKYKIKQAAGASYVFCMSMSESCINAAAILEQFPKKQIWSGRKL